MVKTMDVHFSSKSYEWETPPDFFKNLNDEFGFDIDVCATSENAKCKEYFTKSEDGLNQKWCGEIHQKSPVCWMNPPYGRQISKWIRKAYESSLDGATVVCLVPARTDTAWWHDYVVNGEIRFIRGRLYFLRPDGSTGRAPFPCAVIIFKP